MGIDANSAEYGIVLRQHYEGTEEWLEIISAMPRALFSAELLHEVRTGRRSLDIMLDKPEIGGVLRIRGRDRTLVYVLTEHNFELDYFIGEWPD